MDALLEILRNEKNKKIASILDYIYYYCFTNNNFHELEKAVVLIEELIEETKNV